ncbi:helix-turn-helix transcriptional regulator [Frigidibacter sp. ROC022]|uniref:helix-turn-helix transcriptional regulator n=1 Tax=Frigidibacter sp. ROC022 TaxID=2971796 RepID=UPI00215ACBDF|nr:AlpA family transcriptional regulator [Frigidibacter sp. ROC022]MCR8724552.1 AlpA family transcriptional regulator [Frigidibacter sp. ROC022]
MQSAHNKIHDSQAVEQADLLLKVREAAGLLSISVPTFWRRVADGTIPKPIKLGGLSRWTKSEILAVIETAKKNRYDTE